MKHLRTIPIAPALLVILALLALLAPLAPGAAAEAPKPGTGVRYVYLVRHGMYDRDSTADDVAGNGLNELGHDQAKRIGARLAGLPFRPDRFVSSSMLRARQTADDIGRELGMTPARDSLIQECTPTTLRTDYLRNHSAEEIALCDSNLARAWRRYFTPSPDRDRHDLLVCHGNVIRWLVSRALDADTRRWHLMDIGNASLTVIAVRPDGTTRLVMFSDVGHLPLAKQTWSGKGGGWNEPAPR